MHSGNRILLCETRKKSVKKYKGKKYLAMNAIVRFRILGHLTRAASVRALPSTPVTMMTMIIAPEKRSNPPDDLKRLYRLTFYTNMRYVIVKRKLCVYVYTLCNSINQCLFSYKSIQTNESINEMHHVLLREYVAIRAVGRDGRVERTALVLQHSFVHDVIIHEWSTYQSIG